MKQQVQDVAPRLAAELVVIVLGVLVALWVDGWNVSRTERGEEHEILLQLSDDMAEHREQFAWISEALDTKEKALRTVEAGLRAPGRVADTTAFLGEVVRGANLGWAQPRMDRSTFDELLGSGRMRLIRDPQLRRALTSYFALEQEAERRAAPRRGPYPETAYALIPLAASYGLAEGIDTRDVFRRVADSDLRHQVTSELNLTLFMRDRFTELYEAAEALHTDLVAALEASGSP